MSEETYSLEIKPGLTAHFASIDDALLYVGQHGSYPDFMSACNALGVAASLDAYGLYSDRQRAIDAVRVLLRTPTSTGRTLFAEAQEATSSKLVRLQMSAIARILGGK